MCWVPVTASCYETFPTHPLSSDHRYLYWPREHRPWLPMATSSTMPRLGQSVHSPLLLLSSYRTEKSSCLHHYL